MVVKDDFIEKFHTCTIRASVLQCIFYKSSMQVIFQDSIICTEHRAGTNASTILYGISNPCAIYILSMASRVVAMVSELGKVFVNSVSSRLKMQSILYSCRMDSL